MDQGKIEAQAKAQGWNPDYKGENARTAEEFLQVGENISAVQAENNKKLLDKVESLESMVSQQNDTFKSFQAQQFKVIEESRQEGHDKAMKSIEKKQRTAAEEGDVEKYDALEAEKKAIKKPAPVADTAPKRDPEFTAWHKDNSWYNQARPDALTVAADNYGKFLLQERKDLTGPAYYKEVEKHIKTVFSDQFKSADPGKIDAGNPGNPKPSGGKGYKDLPKEAKEACDMFVKQGLVSKEEYCKEYPWGEE